VYRNITEIISGQQEQSTSFDCFSVSSLLAHDEPWANCC